MYLFLAHKRLSFYHRYYVMFYQFIDFKSIIPIRISVARYFGHVETFFNAT